MINFCSLNHIICNIMWNHLCNISTFLVDIFLSCQLCFTAHIIFHAIIIYLLKYFTSYYFINFWYNLVSPRFILLITVNKKYHVLSSTANLWNAYYKVAVCRLFTNSHQMLIRLFSTEHVSLWNIFTYSMFNAE